MRTRWFGPTAALLFSLIQATGAAAQRRFGRRASGRRPPPSRPSPTVDVSRLPINLDRIQRQLRQSTVRDESDGLRLRYVVDVFGQAPRIELFARVGQCAHRSGALRRADAPGHAADHDAAGIPRSRRRTSATSFAGSRTKRRRTSRQVACAFFSSLRPRPRSAQSRPGCVAMAIAGRGRRGYAGAGHDVDVLVTGVGMVATAAWCAQRALPRALRPGAEPRRVRQLRPSLPPGTVVHVVSRPARRARRRGRRDVSPIHELQPARRERAAVRQRRAREPRAAGQRHAGQRFPR